MEPREGMARRTSAAGPTAAESADGAGGGRSSRQRSSAQPALSAPHGAPAVALLYVAKIQQLSGFGLAGRTILGHAPARAQATAGAGGRR